MSAKKQNQEQQAPAAPAAACPAPGGEAAALQAEIEAERAKLGQERAALEEERKALVKRREELEKGAEALEKQRKALGKSQNPTVPAEPRLVTVKALKGVIDDLRVQHRNPGEVFRMPEEIAAQLKERGEVEIL